MRVSLRPMRLRFRAPVVTAYGELPERELIELELIGADGVVGVGEAAPLEPYDGVALGAVREALEAYRAVLEAGEGASGGELLDACRQIADLPQALAAVDLALWDRAGRREGRPVAALLAGDPALRVPVSRLVGALAPPQAAAEATAAVRAGFRCLKVKVARGDDEARLAAVRQAIGPDVELRLDANGAWTLEQATEQIGRLARFSPALIEEPVHGPQALRALSARTQVPLALDESATVPGAIAAGVAAAVVLKISSSGGISALLARASLARAAGSEVYLGSSFDGPVGVAAALHAAAALAPLPACGLATLSLFADLEDPFPAREGAITVPARPGLR